MKARVVIGVAVCLALVALIVLSRTGNPRHDDRAISSWLRQCADTPLDQDKQIKEAQAAVCAIGAEKVLPKLLSLIKTRDTRVRKWLVDQSEKFEGRFFLFESVTELQLQGIAGFEALGTNAAPAVGELSQLLADKEHAFMAARCLANIGKPAEFTLVRCLTNQNHDVRRLSVEALAAVTDDAEVYVARIKPRLNDRESAVRFATVQALGAQTNAPDLAVPLLLASLADTDDGVACEAAGLLAGFGTNAAGAFPNLVNLVDSGITARARAALFALPAIAPAEAVPVLSNAVVNGDAAILGMALKSLKTIAPELARAMMFDQFRSPDSLRRAQVALAAVAFEPTTPGLADALKAAAADADAAVARRALATMRHILEKRKETTVGFVVLPGEPVCQGRPLGEWLKLMQPNGGLSADGEAAVKSLGTNAVPPLLARLQYREPMFGLEDFDVRMGGVNGLIVLGEQAWPALPTLMALMDSDDERLALLAMLASLGTGSNAAPCLMKGLTSQSPDLRNEAAGQFTGDWGKQFPEQRKPAMPFLVKLLDDPDQYVRMYVTNGLKYLDQEPSARIHQH